LGDVLPIVPDKGARPRVEALTVGLTDDLVQCNKVRNPQTGKIETIKIEGIQRVKDRDCLIIDDICDGGATFTTIAMALKDAGAKTVNLYVTHGIFSKGFRDLVPDERYGGKGQIDRIFCTDSYRDWQNIPHVPVSCIPVSMEKM
jgi:ribose-phosphate pyrophosphokinase